jgi:ankyrin repeat protein
MFGSNKGKYEEIIEATLKAQTLTVHHLLEKYNVKPTDSNLVDKSNQNLLHMSVRAQNPILVEYLMENNVSHTAKNIFGETAMDIAIKNNDTHIVELLCGSKQIESLKKSCKKLETKCDEYKFNFEKASIINTQLKSEMEKGNKSLKRQRELYETQGLELKRVRTENGILKVTVTRQEVTIHDQEERIVRLNSDNNVLQVTIKNLRDSMKK